MVGPDPCETSSEIKDHRVNTSRRRCGSGVVARDRPGDGHHGSGCHPRSLQHREDLIAALIADSYASPADVMEAAGAGMPMPSGARAPGRRDAAYRQWAISHPEEFRLIYGDP